MPEFFVFKAGKYPQGHWPKERVKRLVEAYDPENKTEAPAVIGHRSFATRDADQYAHGWVEKLRVDDEGKVYASIQKFSKEARRAIKEKKLRYISVEIYEFDKVDKAEPPYLKAVALLGRDNPAVPGTRIPTMFSKLFSGGVVNTVDEKKRVSTFTRKVNDEDINALFDARQVSTQEDVTMGKTAEKLQAELERSHERIAELEKSAAEAALFRKENEELKNSSKKKEAEAYYGKLRDEGRLPPARFEKAVALDLKLDAEGRKEMRAMFADMEVKVDLSGKHKADKKNADTQAASGSDLAAKIRAFQKERKLESFNEAATVLHAEKPELFDQEEADA